MQVIQDQVVDDMSVLGMEVLRQIDALSSDIAEFGIAESRAERARVEELGREFARHISEMVETFLAHTLEGLEATWNGDPELWPELRRDYAARLRMVDHYVRGFVAGGGVTWSLVQGLEDGPWDRASVTRCLRGRLLFIHEKLEMAAIDWTQAVAARMRGEAHDDGPLPLHSALDPIETEPEPEPEPEAPRDERAPDVPIESDYTFSDDNDNEFVLPPVQVPAGASAGMPAFPQDFGDLDDLPPLTAQSVAEEPGPVSDVLEAAPAEEELLEAAPAEEELLEAAPAEEELLEAAPAPFDDPEVHTLEAGAIEDYDEPLEAGPVDDEPLEAGPVDDEPLEAGAIEDYEPLEAGAIEDYEPLEAGAIEDYEEPLEAVPAPEAPEPLEAGAIEDYEPLEAGAIEDYDDPLDDAPAEATTVPGTDRPAGFQPLEPLEAAWQEDEDDDPTVLGASGSRGRAAERPLHKTDPYVDHDDDDDDGPIAFDSGELPGDDEPDDDEPDDLPGYADDSAIDEIPELPGDVWEPEPEAPVDDIPPMPTLEERFAAVIALAEQWQIRVDNLPEELEEDWVGVLEARVADLVERRREKELEEQERAARLDSLMALAEQLKVRVKKVPEKPSQSWLDKMAAKLQEVQAKRGELPSFAAAADLQTEERPAPAAEPSPAAPAAARDSADQDRAQRVAAIVEKAERVGVPLGRVPDTPTDAWVAQTEAKLEEFLARRRNERREERERKKQERVERVARIQREAEELGVDIGQVPPFPTDDWLNRADLRIASTLLKRGEERPVDPEPEPEPEPERVPQIIYEAGTLQEQRWIVDRDMVIGRAPDSDIQLIFDGGVSRRHCRVRMLGNGQFAIEDAGSTKGTMVDGSRISDTMPLPIGSVIQIGDTRLQFEMVPLES
ncbi:MAG: FHA domain-containing protein [Myxococcota bacterium]